MDSLFTYSDYRKYLNHLAEVRRLQGRTKAELSRVLGCQAAYFSQVLAEKVDLTEEHLLRLGRHLEFNDLEMEYLLLLLRFSKAGNAELKQYLGRHREKLIESAKELLPRLDVQRGFDSDELKLYYSSSWVPSLLHVATSCPTLQTVAALANRLNLEEAVVQHHLDRLHKFRLVEFHDGRWSFAGSSVYFPKNSASDQQMQVARRLLAMHHLSFRQEEDMHYSVTFATTPATARLLRATLLDVIESVHTTVEPTASEEIYALCLDFFKP